MKLLLIDNYDSFTWNLVQRIGELDRGIAMEVVRNDKIAAEAVEDRGVTHLLMSPGPGTPADAGVCGALVERYRGRLPIFGVCLGHQTIGERHGMSVVRHDVLMHGKTSEIEHDGRGLFAGLPNPFTATRYHSLIVDRATVGADFEVSAWTARGEVMGLRWKGGDGEAPMEGVQFHPESFLTRYGVWILANFLGLERPAVDEGGNVVRGAGVE